MGKRILPLLLLLLVAVPGQGFEQKKVAVLELKNDSALKNSQATFLTNQVRIAASRMLSSSQFTVLTQENIEELLPPDVTLAKRTDAKCEVEIGKMLHAEYIITGDIVDFGGGELRIQLRVHHVPTAKLLGGESTGAGDLKAQEKMLATAAATVMTAVLLHAGVASPPPPPNVAQPPDGGAVTPTQPAADPEFEKLVQAEQAKLEAKKRLDAENKAKLDADYAAVKAIHDNASYSAHAKKVAYQRFVEKWLSGTTRRPEVQQWLQTADALAGMVRIPGGTFMMGCSPGDSECSDDEKPAHRVSVNAFWMDATEVTQGQYQSVTGLNPSAFSGCPNCPVERATWDNAQSYCAKVGKRLPTEAEWEFAARGGTTGSRYGSIDSVAWYDGNSAKVTHRVGQKQPNAYGLYDMLGNVGEWYADWYGEKYYSSSPSNNPRGPSSGQCRVLRGGSWGINPDRIRASDRGYRVPPNRIDIIGLRCVRDN